MIYCRKEIFNMNLKQVLHNDKFSFFNSGNNSAYNIGVTDLFLEGDWVYAHSRTPVEVALPWTNGGRTTTRRRTAWRLPPSPRTADSTQTNRVPYRPNSSVNTAECKALFAKLLLCVHDHVCVVQDFTPFKICK